MPALLTTTEIKQNCKLLKAVPWIHLPWPRARTAHAMYQQQYCAAKKNLLDWEHKVHHLYLTSGCHHLTTQTDLVGTPRKKPPLEDSKVSFLKQQSYSPSMLPATGYIIHPQDSCWPAHLWLELRRDHATVVKQGCHCLMSSAALQVFHNTFLTISFKMWYPLFFMTPHNRQ